MTGQESNTLAKDGEREPRSPEDVQARVLRLTTIATNLYKRGSFEVAFDSLMKAYLLDPSNPHVIACEKTLMPALEMMRRRGTLLNEQGESSSSENLQLARHLVEQIQNVAEEQQREPGFSIEPSKSAKTPDASPGQQKRLEAIKHQIELARKEKERAMWREASKPPKTYGTRVPDDPKPSDAASPEDSKQPRGFFSKLRQGKFLG